MAKLPMSKVRKNAKKFDDKVTIPFIEDGKEYEVLFQPYFDNQTIGKVIKELHSSLKKYTEYKIEITDELFQPLLAYYTLKHFSDLTTPQLKDYKDEENYYKADAQYFFALYDGDYIKTITEYFIENEWSKMNEAVINILIANEKYDRQMKKMQQQIQGIDLQSEELKSTLQPKRIPEV